MATSGCEAMSSIDLNSGHPAHAGSASAARPQDNFLLPLVLGVIADCEVPPAQVPALEKIIRDKLGSRRRSFLQTPLVVLLSSADNAAKLIAEIASKWAKEFAVPLR